MSTLEKAIGLLQQMPERKLEAVYMYIRFVNSQTYSDEAAVESVLMEKEVNSYKNVAVEKFGRENSIEKRQQGFQGLMSFAGTLPEDFDYEHELEKAREEKYARFI